MSVSIIMKETVSEQIGTATETVFIPRPQQLPYEPQIPRPK
jgi:hypothetical protein